MGTFSFRAGTTVTINGAPLRLLRKIDDQAWRLEDETSGRITCYSHEQLLGLYSAGTLKRHKATVSNTHLSAHAKRDERDERTLASFPPERLEPARMRRLYATATIGIPNTEGPMKRVIAKTWEKYKLPATPPHWTTVWRWKRQFEAAGKNFLALVENHAAQGNRSERFPEAVRAIVEESIERIYLTMERGNVQDTLDTAKAMVNRENRLLPKAAQLPQPSRRLVKRMIADIPEYEKCVARWGKDVADNRYRLALGGRLTAVSLGCAQVDHTPLNLMVIDDATMMPLGRPWLTAIIDDHSRCVLGIYISFEPPSFFTVARALKHAIEPKSTLKEQYPDIENEWAPHGVMESILVDNGREFHSKDLENACYALGIEIEYCARKRSWLKGKIERFLGTLNRGVTQGVPGSTFSNIFEKADYNPVKTAVVRYSTLKALVHKWVADVYHQKVHRALGAPPAVTWANSIRQEDIRLSDTPELLDIFLGKSNTRQLTHKGIEIHSMFYNSPELGALRLRYGTTQDVDIRTDAADLGHIFVITPNGQPPIKVPCTTFEYANGISLYQHKVCKRYAAQELEKYDPRGWLEAKLRIREMIEAEFNSGKRRMHAKAARYIDNDTEVDMASKATKIRRPRSKPARSKGTSDVAHSQPSPSQRSDVSHEPLRFEDIGPSNTEKRQRRLQPMIMQRASNPEVEINQEKEQGHA